FFVDFLAAGFSSAAFFFVSVFLAAGFFSALLSAAGFAALGSALFSAFTSAFFSLFFSAFFSALSAGAGALPVLIMRSSLLMRLRGLANAGRPFARSTRYSGSASVTCRWHV